jgi:toxin ParE1/3/4
LAERDLDDIWDYYAINASPEIAERLLMRIGGRVEQAGKRPTLGRMRGDLLSGMRSMRAAPYLIFYLVTDSAIEIVRVIHERRDLGQALTESLS